MSAPDTLRQRIEAALRIARLKVQENKHPPGTRWQDGVNWLASEMDAALSAPVPGREEMREKMAKELYLMTGIRNRRSVPWHELGPEAKAFTLADADRILALVSEEAPRSPEPPASEPRLCEDCGKDTVGRDGPYGCCEEGCRVRVFLCLDCFYGLHPDGHVLCKAHRGPVVPLTEKEEK